MATLTVGQGQEFSTIAAAINASHDGDVIQVQAGTYTNDFAEIKTKITLEGVGGMVHMVATGNIPNDKGILVTDTDVTIDHFEFSGAQGPSGNDAGIRYQGGNLTLTNDYFHDNQDGLLANPSPTGTITIKNSEFSHNGTGDGYTHNLYVNDIAKLSISDSYFHDAVVGHEIKSRAEVTEITNTRIFDNSGNSSYSIDLPNGGQATLSGNTIEQGPNGGNPNIVAYGEEGSVHANSSITMTNNTVLNDMSRGTLLWDASNTSGTVQNNQVWGLTDSQMVSGSGATVSGTTHLSSEPALDTSHPFDGGGSTTPPPTDTTSGGGGGENTVPGTSGDDVLAGQADSPNYIRGGDGADTITGGTLYDDINGNKGDDSIVGHSTSGDWLLGGQGADHVDAHASTGHNIINGNIGADTLLGGSGGDSLRGGQGDDVVTGGTGSDWLSGDMGSNTLTGGQGADTFHASANSGVSVVTDFDGTHGDRVQLDAGTTYHLSQEGADLHIVLDSGQGGELVLQNTSQQAFQSGWILTH